MNTPYKLPALGSNPGPEGQGTTPGSFAQPPLIQPGPGGARTFASPDTPGMPQVSTKTAWDFLPEGWSTHLAAGATNGSPGL